MAPLLKKRKKDSTTVAKVLTVRLDNLAPQAEVPRQGSGTDRSTQKSAVKELSWSQFDRQIQTLARKIRETYKPDAVVGVAHGGVFVGGAIASALATDFYPVRISRRSRDKHARNAPKLTGELPKELKGKRVLIVDDVVNSGDTLELAISHARQVGAKQAKTACLVARESGYEPDFVAMTTGTLFVFPWDYEPVVEDTRFDVDPDKAGA